MGKIWYRLALLSFLTQLANFYPCTTPREGAPFFPGSMFGSDTSSEAMDPRTPIALVVCRRTCTRKMSVSVDSVTVPR